MHVRPVTITAPSRLHFGMFSFGHPNVRQFGGVGAMIDSPGLRISIVPADHFSVAGLHADRAASIATQIHRRMKADLNSVVADFSDKLCCAISIDQAPREHTGLGTGTQLTLAIAAGLRAFFGRPPLAAVQMAQLADRGERSAIGTYGFEQGGLLVEAGKLIAGSLSPLVARAALPAAWRFVLIVPRDTIGRHGEEERRAFHRLPAVAIEATERLSRLALLELLPAAIEQRFDEFSRALYEYGELAGQCFSSVQHGAFADRRTAELIAQLRSMGIVGVGQTSWGPTVFAACENELAAQQLSRDLQSSLNAAEHECLVAAPSNQGATLHS